MSRLATYVVRFVLILTGFLAACAAASLFVNVLFVSTVGAVIPEFAEVAGPSLFVTVPFLTLIIANLAFGPFLLVAVAAELLGWRSWIAHASGGAVVALYAGWQMAAFIDRPDVASDPGLTLFTLAAGLVGGIAYWAIVGRTAGNWRDEPISPVS